MIFPKVVLSGRTHELWIHPNESQFFDPNDQYQATLFPVEDLDSSDFFWERPKLPARVWEGKVCLEAFFEREQKYILSLERLSGPDSELIGDYSLYALEEDLFDRFPFRGDLHMHTHYSDGVESPAEVAAMCRKIGLDFMAITDHGLYFPSIEAQDAFSGVAIDLNILSGEEVHPPENPIHILNIGGKFSINTLFDSPGYREETARCQASLKKLPPGTKPEWVASAIVCFEKIHQAAGLGVFCHPYWFANRAYRIPESLTTTIFELQPYDVFELIGGYHKFETASNVLQVARYFEETAKGKRIPIIGVSDAHGCQRGLFGWYSTLVFSHSLDFTDLATSIKDLFSVAVEALPGEAVHIYGPLRLVKFAYFVLEELIPAHDILCSVEGDLMLAHLLGDGQARSELSALVGQIRQFYERCYHRG